MLFFRPLTVFGLKKHRIQYYYKWRYTLLFFFLHGISNECYTIVYRKNDRGWNMRFYFFKKKANIGIKIKILCEYVRSKAKQSSICCFAWLVFVVFFFFPEICNYYVFIWVPCQEEMMFGAVRVFSVSRELIFFLLCVMLKIHSPCLFSRWDWFVREESDKGSWFLCVFALMGFGY